MEYLIPSNEETTSKNTNFNQIQYIDTFESLNLPVGTPNFIFDDNAFENVEAGLYAGQSGYYLVIADTKKAYKQITRITNFIFKPEKLVIQKDFNQKEHMNCLYEMTFFVNNRYYTARFLPDELLNLKKFERKMSSITHILTTLDDKKHKTLMTQKLSEENNLPKITEFKTAGYNIEKGVELFVTADGCFSYCGQDFLDLKDIKLSDKAILKPRFSKYEDIISDENIKKLFCGNDFSKSALVSKLLLILFNTLENAYNKRIEPYIVLAMGFMAIFLKQISNDFVGTPIIALYGEAASGKTNLLRLIASAFGFDKSVLHGGMDTTAGLIEDLENYVNIPLLVDEVELNNTEEAKRLIKAVYGQTGRKKYNCKNNINTTLFFNSNNKFLYDLEYKNRCIELNFVQENFNCKKAENFNKFQSHLSFISQYIIENISYHEIKKEIYETEQSEMLCQIKDSRIKRNLAIAIAGLKMLIKLIDVSEGISINNFVDRINNYIVEATSIYEEDIDKFLNILKVLLDERGSKLKKDEDYKILSDGVHIFMSKRKQTFFEANFNITYQKYYKNSKVLDMDKYKKLLINKGAEMKNVHYSNTLGTRYGIFLPFNIFTDIRHLLDRISPFESCTNNIISISNLNNPF